MGELRDRAALRGAGDGRATSLRGVPGGEPARPGPPYHARRAGSRSRCALRREHLRGRAQLVGDSVADRRTHMADDPRRPDAGLGRRLRLYGRDRSESAPSAGRPKSPQEPGDRLCVRCHYELPDDALTDTEGLAMPEPTDSDPKACRGCKAGVDRRTFLSAATLVAVAAVLDGCTTLAGPGGSSGGSYGGPFTVTLASFGALATVGGTARMDNGSGAPTALYRSGASSFVALAMICTHP